MAAKEKINLLDVIPCRSEHITVEREGETIVLSFPRFKYTWMQRFLVPKGMSKELHVHLEEHGTVVWELIDGKRTVREIIEKLADHFQNEEGYESFVVPDDVGGRFSVLTAVGLLPIAVSGADIDALMQGAADARKNALETPFEKNSALLYAAVRNILLRKGKQVEIVANYEPSLHYVSEWWKQLYGESEGKDQKGIFPAAVDLTTDLHSMGQFIQDGARIMFETVLEVAESPAEIILKKEDVDTDGMNYLAGKSVDFVNKSAMNGTILAHTDGSVPNLKVTIPAMDAYSLGQLFYFFEFACGVSGYLLGVNPFNQPGVESYKKNMFALLGKPGYEGLTAELEAKLK